MTFPFHNNEQERNFINQISSLKPRRSKKELFLFYHDILDKIPLEINQLQANIILDFALSLGKEEFLSSLHYHKLQKATPEDVPHLIRNILSSTPINEMNDISIIPISA